MCVCVCVCFLPIHSGHRVRWTYQPGSHRRKVTQNFHPPYFCGACLNFSREKDSAFPFPRRPWSILCTNDLIVLHPFGILFLFFSFFSEKNPVCRDRTHVPTCQRVTRYLWATGATVHYTKSLFFLFLEWKKGNVSRKDKINFFFVLKKIWTHLDLPRIPQLLLFSHINWSATNPAVVTR